VIRFEIKRTVENIIITELHYMTCSQCVYFLGLDFQHATKLKKKKLKLYRWSFIDGKIE